MDRFTKLVLAALTFGVWALVLGQNPVSPAQAKAPDADVQQQISAAGVFMTENGVTAYDPTGKAFMLFPATNMPFIIIRDGKMSLWQQYDDGSGPKLTKLDEKTL